MWSHPEAHPGDYLRVRFMEPLDLTASDLARGCHMPRSRVSDILAGKRAITADTAKRLGAFFQMSPEIWLSLQAQWDLEQARVEDPIVPLEPPGFLLGPAGATPIPARRRTGPRYLHVPRQELATQPNERDVHHEEVRYADGTRALVAKRS